MTEEIIFLDTTKNIELYSDGTTNISREKYDTLTNKFFNSETDKTHLYKQLKQAENTVNKCHKYQAELEDKIDSLEQDSKQLTQWLDEARNNADFWCNKCTSKEQENKEQKAQVDYLSKRETELISEITDIVADNKSFNEVLIDFSKRMVNQRENYYKEYNKYRAALEEIKDYADALYNEPLIDGSKIRLHSGMYRIKTKINKVLGKDNE